VRLQPVPDGRQAAQPPPKPRNDVRSGPAFTSAAGGGFVALFNGKDLSGWFVVARPLNPGQSKMARSSLGVKTSRPETIARRRRVCRLHPPVGVQSR